ncbi:unnamed protein product [Vitrella brassicaformis CCMP3155]|uniref:Enoyl reductase (ER) domain-containing protein n=1 Tax=Vitrella brassicaformis (strain CCMP3155) TaxID=1169540 RepID=A0A0G4GZY6_VITBC|nr:unnamed protein product [Vitrella brassicaformis CCMP3155]|mmetsp:Transcript_43705/g.123813  ORF Transcript_43705/g.123813 Transcript_43705/m.123813 type:complete len:364 (-) Transcript_43705:2628-3719(-)|eukprot:CEM36796.1 unnamed protein product [Vitrella brassicaformis CCMP3155]
MPILTSGYAARDESGHMSPFVFEHRDVGPHDVHIKVTYCGMCHSDLHQIKNEWHNSSYPMVPGHEVVGIVSAVGSEVTKVKVGDSAGVGCMVDSCLKCDRCLESEEQYCIPGMMIGTYNAKNFDGTPTYGGYSLDIVVKDHFVLRMPSNLPLDAAAPLLCAGITTWSPMRFYGMDKPGTKVGVVGLGGLGHMAVKFGVAFGCEVTVISSSASKEKEAIEVLGAHKFLCSKDPEAMKAASESLDFIVDTASVKKDMAPYFGLLKIDGTLVVVGIAPEPLEIHAFSLIPRRKKIAGSLIGGIKETQEMLDFCGDKNIACTIEKIPMDYVNTAFERMTKSDVKYRFVIDCVTIPTADKMPEDARKH